MRDRVVTTPSTAGSRAPPADGSEACAAARGHVLLVDDDVELCELLAMRVRANGYRVTVTPGIASTLERLERERVDMVLLDLDLGADHGFDLLDALVARSLPVIVLTASGTADTEAEARRRGAAGFITKPFHHRELLQTISRAVAGARAPDQPSGYF
jgi:two-component system response regulator GlrR